MVVYIFMTMIPIRFDSSAKEILEILEILTGDI